MLTYGSLFSGIGGIDLGLDQAGMTCKWQVEINEYAQKILTKYWPYVVRHLDVRTVGKHNLTSVDLIAGGFPCQDISIAGDREGIAGERSGLWSEFCRIIGELRPRYVLVENVSALLAPVEHEQYIEPAPISRVLGDLAACGYDAQWQTLPASAFGAPHRRDRTFIVAYHSCKRVQRLWTRPLQRVKAFSWCQDVRSLEDLRNRPDLPPSLVWGNRNGIPSYVDRIRVIGNAVVPQVAEYIGRCIIEFDRKAG